ncbi:MAG: polysaccharide deacetylase family protein [Deltaproteobacteria bacterium]|nr:polysaccharide deacetylase family protein [Kofleriaceae bacterium]
MSITRQVPLLFVLGCGGGHHADTGDGGGSNNNGDGGRPPVTCTEGLGAWTGNDNVPASQQPPCGLSPEQVPQFVSIGWDDNGQVGGMTWAVDMLRDRGKASFFLTCTYAQASAWRAAYMAGHEIGNHTVTHATDRNVGLPRWLQEMNDCNTYIKDMVGVPADEIIGFRTPFLKYDNDTLAAVKQVGFRYDSSIEEGYEWDDNANNGNGATQDGTNFYWPYTLDNRSPGHTTQVEWGEGLIEIDPRPGLWELPVYAVVVPPDDKCAQYGVEPGLRAELKQRQSWFDVNGGLITGFDYNLWASTSVGGFAMTKAEFVATLKYTLDQRLAGNRSPFLFGAHTDYYVASWNQNAAGTPAENDRRAAIEEFLDYAGSKPEVEITTYARVLEFVRNPGAQE